MAGRSRSRRELEAASKPGAFGTRPGGPVVNLQKRNALPTSQESSNTILRVRKKTTQLGLSQSLQGFLGIGREASIFRPRPKRKRNKK